MPEIWTVSIIMEKYFRIKYFEKIFEFKSYEHMRLFGTILEFCLFSSQLDLLQSLWKTFSPSEEFLNVFSRMGENFNRRRLKETVAWNGFLVY